MKRIRLWLRRIHYLLFTDSRHEDLIFTASFIELDTGINSGIVQGDCADMAWQYGYHHSDIAHDIHELINEGFDYTWALDIERRKLERL